MKEAPGESLERAKAPGLAADIRLPHFGACIAANCRRRGVRVKSVRIINRVAVLLVGAPIVWGCASALVGLQSDGTYVLERNEQSATCEALYKSIWGRIELIKTLPEKARKEQRDPPPTASSLFGRLFSGPNKGLVAVQEYNRERSHAYALQRAMNEKKCVTVELDRELADVATEMAQIREN